MKIKIKDNIDLTRVKDINRDSDSVDNEYVVIGLDDTHFRIINDYGEPILYPKNIFVITDDERPDDWDRCDYEDGEYHVNPKPFAMAGFYEDQFKDISQAVGMFKNFILKYNYMTMEN